jgi:hypothetical protein
MGHFQPGRLMKFIVAEKKVQRKYLQEEKEEQVEMLSYYEKYIAQLELGVF